MTRHHGWEWLTVALVATACGEPPADPAPATTDHSLASAPAPALTPGTITLITGDRVRITMAGGRAVPMIFPGPGRSGIAFSIDRDRDELTVLPEDAAHQVAAGQLDRALFNVTRLIADGFGDDKRDDLPLIITGADATAAQRRIAAAGVTVDRVLPALHVMTVRHRKASSGAGLASLVATLPARAPARPTKIWLDRARHVTLDRSVPQIGAPAAYARGLTGAGVTVAVLDSGVDTGHPDLAGKVVAAENFTDDGGGVSDVVGHGTHVASIIAGTGAASAGRFHGVAPDATLISGRVCDAFGCFDSWILAGMEWAVATQHAPIVNMSLGGFDFPDLDPLDEAVNQLSAEFGTLFVVAAGNFGDTRVSIDSPGSADAALTVGAVTRSDARASFSGQGPRAGDHAIKPDVMAPGVGIVAARAAGATIGTPVDASYLQLSGTSMATPHVAGAAAILRQQHPDWSGARLKAALMDSASPNPELTVYKQGAGRLDVDRATRQTVIAEPASLSLGPTTFPHDDDPPLSRTVRYTNQGAVAVALTLAATLATEDGRPAPAGMVVVEPSALTVPARGAADVVVSVDTRGTGPIGVLGGTLVATGDDIRVITPLGVEREPESHELTVRVIGGDGQPGTALLTIAGVGRPEDPHHDVEQSQFMTDSAVFRLPVGPYAITCTTSPGAQFLVVPRFSLTTDTEIILDARIARPIEPRLPQRGLAIAFSTLDVSDLLSGRGHALLGPGTVSSAEIGPSAPPGEILSNARVVMAPAGETSPAVIYDLAHTELDHMMTGWQQTLRRSDLTTVQARHVGPDDQHFTKITTPVPIEVAAHIAGFGFGYLGGFARTEQFYGPGFRWYVDLDTDVPFPDIPDFFVPIQTEDALIDLQPGKTLSMSWNQAPFGPAFAGPTLFGLSSQHTGAPERDGDQLVVMPAMFSDQAQPARLSFSQVDEQRLTLLRGGQVIAEARDPQSPDFLFVTLPPEPAQYRLENEVTRPADPFALSTRVSAAWTFFSQHVDGAPRVLSLPTLRFSPALDDHNLTSARVLLLPVRIERPVGAATPRIARARVDASFDDGASWSPVPLIRVGDRALGVIVHRPGAPFVSLRGSASDVDGNAVEQTIVRAYGLAPRSP